MVVTIEGFDMPGASCAPEDAGERYENVHAGVQRRNEVVELVRGDGADADADVLAAAVRHGEITCRVRMSDHCGHPRCARVRPPDAEWAASSA